MRFIQHLPAGISCRWTHNRHRVFCEKKSWLLFENNSQRAQRETNMELPRRHFLRWLAASPILASAGGLAAFTEVIDREPNRRVFDDLFKGIARGATAVAIGRPYLWGLGAFGQEGVERVLAILTRELEITMCAAGTPSLASIGPHSIGSTGYIPLAFSGYTD